MPHLIRWSSGVAGALAALLCVAGPVVQTAIVVPPEFVRAATQAGLMEVEAAKLAMNASTTPAVKTFSDRMLTDHQKANEELAVIARKKGITVPTELDAEHVKMLQALRDKSAQEIDMAYAEQMVRDHAQAVELFNANVSNQDRELAEFAARTLPVLQEHRRLADDLKRNLKTPATK